MTARLLALPLFAVLAFVALGGAVGAAAGSPPLRGQMVDIGAYQSGANPALDAALAMAPRLDSWLRQDADAPESRSQAYTALAAILGRQEEEGV